MINTKSVLLLGLLVASVFSLLTFAEARQAQRAATVQANIASATSCTAETLASAMGRAASSLPQATREALVSWCREQAGRDDAKERAMTARSPRSSTPSASGDLAAEPDYFGIICGKNNCVCWKGKHHNGCHHTDKLCSPGSWKCVGPVCGCTTPND